MGGSAPVSSITSLGKRSSGCGEAAGSPVPGDKRLGSTAPSGGASIEGIPAASSGEVSTVTGGSSTSGAFTTGTVGSSRASSLIESCNACSSSSGSGCGATSIGCGSAGISASTSRPTSTRASSRACSRSSSVGSLIENPYFPPGTQSSMFSP